jgi:hypothetical protein
MSTGSTAGLIIFVLGLVFGGIGIILVISALVSRKRAQAAQNWPTTMGQVLSAEIQEHRSYDRNDHHTRLSYEPVVQYSYAVGGQAYSGNRIGFGANSFDQRTAQTKIASYAPGAGITVHYNPENPSKAVLETNASGSNIFLIVGIIFAIIGLLALCGGAGTALMA